MFKVSQGYRVAISSPSSLCALAARYLRAPSIQLRSRRAENARKVTKVSFEFAHTAADTAGNTDETTWGAATTKRAMDSDIQMFLRLQLVTAFSDAENWGDLQIRVKPQDFAL